MLVTDATAAAGRPDGEYQLAGSRVVAKDGVVRGTISGTLPESMAIAADGALYAGETTTGRVLRKFVKQ